METFVFSPSDSDTVEDWFHKISEMYTPRKPVRMFVDLSNFNKFDIKKIIGLKCVLDSYRPLTRLYLQETVVKINEPILKTFVKNCLVLFKPEKPVRFI